MNAPAGERVLLRRAAAAAVLGALALVCILEGATLWDWAAYRAPTRDLGFEVRPKRWSWLPGPGVRIPVQPCPSCQRGSHEACARQSERVTFYFGGTAPLGSGPQAPTSRFTVTADRGISRYSVSADDGTVGEMEFATLELDGVLCTPETFRCPCCDSD